ncbi:MAG TPA: hypothetical protein VN476_05755 [Pyrinomonadaceae bacterium]|nr:hypothetical protein [Pyrinomonadaceae bacterium]
MSNEGGRHKFWSDDFDMDLLKVFPNTLELLGDTADEKVWTVGHDSFGRLNHPVVWNTHGAYVWLDKPNLRRDKHGWFNIDSCVSDDPEIECTWLELLRDQWVHSFAFILLPVRVQFPSPSYRDFERIMYDLRGWHKYEDVQASLDSALKWLVRMNQKFSDVLMDYRTFTPSQEPREAKP